VQVHYANVEMREQCQYPPGQCCCRYNPARDALSTLELALETWDYLLSMISTITPGKSLGIRGSSFPNSGPFLPLYLVGARTNHAPRTWNLT
jgi:hypothetical protein